MAHGLILKLAVVYAAVTLSFGTMESSLATELPDEADDVPQHFVGALAAGEVTAVDPVAGTLTIRHGLIPNPFMEPMTMIFRVSDRSLLEGRRSGDKIRFKVERAGRSFVVVWIENSN